jgi:hypothetical protein
MATFLKITDYDRQWIGTQKFGSFCLQKALLFKTKGIEPE